MRFLKIVCCLLFAAVAACSDDPIDRAHLVDQAEADASTDHDSDVPLSDSESSAPDAADTAESEQCVCSAASACCDGCQPIGVGAGCDDGLSCTTGTTCQPDGQCAGLRARRAMRRLVIRSARRRRVTKRLGARRSRTCERALRVTTAMSRPKTTYAAMGPALAQPVRAPVRMRAVMAAISSPITGLLATTVMATPTAVPASKASALARCVSATPVRVVMGVIGRLGWCVANHLKIRA